MPRIIRTPKARQQITITKLEAAERQLIEAIRLFFEERDVVSIHTLVSAAHQILADLGRARGYGGILRNPDIIKKGHEREFRRVIAEAENFFKHADRDADSTLNFLPRTTELCLLDAILIHRLLTGEVPWPLGVYMAWFAAVNPDLFLDSPYKQVILNVLKNPSFDIRDKELVRMTIERFGAIRLPAAPPSAKTPTA